MKERAAIVLAAGKGTRMKSGLAKVLHQANGRPLAFYPVRAALESGCDPVVAVVGYQGEDVRQALAARFPASALRFATQEKQLGTAHAVLAARRALSRHRGRVLILYGDVPLIEDRTLAALARAGRKSPVAFVTMRLADPTGYGRIVRDGRGRPTAIVEHRDASPSQRAITECNAGLYDCDAAFLWKALGRVGSKNAQSELYLTDLVAMAHEAGTPAVAVEAPADEVSGVNDRVELARAARVLRRRVLEAHMRAGVTVIDPDATYVEDGVTLGADVVLEPGVTLAGSTSLGPGVRVGTGSSLTDMTVGPGTTILPYTVMDSSRVGARCVLGPFARVRPGSELADEVHLGNFVEAKKSRIGKGSKANHLTYLGDAIVGERTNVGAGTITCNYDGVSKHPTVLGDGVFIGSDTQLVAPVTVGDGAYVGAGSTIVSDVPPGALALSRAPQVVKEGWVARRKKAAATPGARKKAPSPRIAARRARR